METKDRYLIMLDGLEEKAHTFEMHADDDFYQNYKEGEIKGGDVAVEIVLLKRKTSLLLTINLSGVVRLVCDRCLEIYDQPINISDEILVNYADETNFDTNNEAVTLSRDSNKIDVSRFIYEYSHFALPIAHYHSEDEYGQPTCDKKMLELIERYKVEEKEAAMDPRWEALRELNNNN